MRKRNCEIIRQQLDELKLDDAYGPDVSAHLDECADCRDFQRTQTKLRRMVGSLGTVSAPPDFDFRLRARLANEGNATIHLTSTYWPFARRAFAMVATVIVFATGLVVVRNVMNGPPANQIVTTGEDARSLPPAVDTTNPTVENTPATVADSKPPRVKGERFAQGGPRIKRPLAAVDFSSQRAEVIGAFEPVETPDATAIFPIDASLQSLKVSLDDGRGNARTISVPTIRFGSQRMLPNGNQFDPKRIW
jgi:hypothetical protein